MVDRGRHDVRTHLKSCLQLQIAGLERAFVAYDVHLNGQGEGREHQASITKVIHSALALVDAMHSAEAQRVRQEQKSARLGLGGRLAAPAKRGSTPDPPQQRVVMGERPVAVAFDHWRRSVWRRGASLATESNHASLPSGSPSEGDGDRSGSFRDSWDGEGDEDDEEDREGDEDELSEPVIFDAGTGAPISLAQLWMDQQMGPDRSEMQMPVAPAQTPAAVLLRSSERDAQGSLLDDLIQGYELSP